MGRPSMEARGTKIVQKCLVLVIIVVVFKYDPSLMTYWCFCLNVPMECVMDLFTSTIYWRVNWCQLAPTCYVNNINPIKANHRQRRMRGYGYSRSDSEINSVLTLPIPWHLAVFREPFSIWANLAWQPIVSATSRFTDVQYDRKPKMTFPLSPTHFAVEGRKSSNTADLIVWLLWAKVHLLHP